jgi:hypothetical protein
MKALGVAKPNENLLPLDHNKQFYGNMGLLVRRWRMTLKALFNRLLA